jgi:pimeloyl-ACP methyl ester carboxylesterase
MSDYQSSIAEYQSWANQCDEIVVETTHGVLRGLANGKGEPAILCIHGNSFCLNIFQHILTSDLTKKHRVIAFDLPGHGGSSDAPGKYSVGLILTFFTLSHLKVFEILCMAAEIAKKQL